MLWSQKDEKGHREKTYILSNTFFPVYKHEEKITWKPLLHREQRDLSFTASLPKEPHRQTWAHLKPEAFWRMAHMGARTKIIVLTSIAFPGALIGNWIGTGATGAWTITHVVGWSYSGGILSTASQYCSCFSNRWKPHVYLSTRKRK